MDWEELQRNSLADPRDQAIEMQVESVEELGRYPREPYTVRPITGGIARDDAILEQHKYAEATLK